VVRVDKDKTKMATLVLCSISALVLTVKSVIELLPQ